jgi:hypothetical protein
LQLEKRAMAKLTTAGHFVLAALDVEPLPAHTHGGRVARQHSLTPPEPLRPVSQAGAEHPAAMSISRAACGA